MEATHDRPRPRRTMRTRAAIAVVLASLLVLAMAAPALAGPTFSEWQLSLWPEYDDPRILVTFSPVIDPTVPLPYTLSYDLPLSAQMGMACQLLPDGQHDCQPPQSKIEGDVKNISFTAPTQRDLYMEYYVDPYEGERPEQREFTYSFVPPGDIQTLQVQIKQPKDAENFAVEPAPQQSLSDAEGYVYLTYAFADVQAGVPVDFTVSYTRPTWVPPAGEDADLATSEGSTAAGSAGSNILLWAVVGILGVIVVMMYRNQKRAKA